MLLDSLLIFFCSLKFIVPTILFLHFKNIYQFNHCIVTVYFTYLHYFEGISSILSSHYSPPITISSDIHHHCWLMDSKSSSICCSHFNLGCPATYFFEAVFTLGFFRTSYLSQSGLVQTIWLDDGYKLTNRTVCFSSFCCHLESL